MEDNTILDNVEIESAADPSYIVDEYDDSASDSTTTELLEEILAEIKGDSINENIEDNLETIEDIASDSIDLESTNDFSEEILLFLESSNYATSEDIETLIQEQNKSIFDKSINDFNVTETLLLVGILVFALSLMSNSIERIFLRWR